MDIVLEWQSPIALSDGSHNLQTYACNLDLVPTKPGIYVFARRHGQKVTPLYVGQAQHLRGRIKSQLNNMRLMKAIEGEARGSRILLLGVLKPGRGQRTETLLKLVEKAYIERAVLDGSPLINIQGTQIRLHTIHSTGKQKHHAPFPRSLSHKAR